MKSVRCLAGNSPAHDAIDGPLRAGGELSCRRATAEASDHRSPTASRRQIRAEDVRRASLPTHLRLQHARIRCIVVSCDINHRRGCLSVAAPLSLRTSLNLVSINRIECVQNFGGFRKAIDERRQIFRGVFSKTYISKNQIVQVGRTSSCNYYKNKCRFLAATLLQPCCRRLLVTFRLLGNRLEQG